MASVTAEFTKGLWKTIAPFRLVLGLCPTLAVTTTGFNGMGMGLATTFVLVFSNLFVSLLRRFIPNQVRIASFIVIIASFVVIVELVMQAYFYQLFKVLGIFIPLIVVNCIILGRAEAFAVLVRRYQDHAYGAAIGRLSDFELARDVVQEAFLCAYRDLRRLRNPARFGGWLRGIVRHRCLRRLRRRDAALGRLALDEGQTAEGEGCPSPEELVQRRDLLARALFDLPRSERDVVTLFYLEERNYKEVAKILGIPMGTLKTHLNRARALLRDALADRDTEGGRGS